MYALDALHKYGFMKRYLVDTSRPRQNGRHFPDDIFKCIFLNENIGISLKMSLKFIPKGPVNNITALVRLGAGQWTSHYLNQWRLVYWRIYASLGLNELNTVLNDAWCFEIRYEYLLNDSFLWYYFATFSRIYLLICQYFRSFEIAVYDYCFCQNLSSSGRYRLFFNNRWLMHRRSFI